MSPQEPKRRFEFYFDISSPWTYLAFHQAQAVALETHATIHWRPFMVGFVFNAVNPSVYAMREKPVPAKAAYMQKDLADWARHQGLPLVWPPTVFPVNSLKVMRACAWLLGAPGTPATDQGPFLRFAMAAFDAYWGRNLDISSDAVLAQLAQETGLDAAELAVAITSPVAKDTVKHHTDTAIARGAFGSPTFFLGDDMYFGNDRLCLVRQALLRQG
jgi:2-hydroxychromene-2-carboxylate isomerase